MKKKVLKTLTGLLILSLALFTIPAYAEVEEEDEAVETSRQENDFKPRSFAVGITTLKEHGFGGVLRGRWNHFAIDGSAGSLPWLVMYQTSSGETTDYDFGMSFHTDASMVIFFNDELSRFQNGIRIGGGYDSIGGREAMIGWTGELTFTSFALCFGLGLQYYPDVIEGLRDRFPNSRNSEISSSQKYQWYLGVNLMWYVF